MHRGSAAEHRPSSRSTLSQLGLSTKAPEGFRYTGFTPRIAATDTTEHLGSGSKAPFVYVRRGAVGYDAFVPQILKQGQRQMEETLKRQLQSGQ